MSKYLSDAYRIKVMLGAVGVSILLFVLTMYFLITYLNRDLMVKESKLMDEKTLNELARNVGGEIKEVGLLPDGSEFATISMPLSKNHWLYGKESEQPPMPWRTGTDDSNREIMRKEIIAAAKYAIREATMNGQDMDFDPDAMVQNFVIGMLGYCTPDGLDGDLLQDDLKSSPENGDNRNNPSN